MTTSVPCLYLEVKVQDVDSATLQPCCSQAYRICILLNLRSMRRAPAHQATKATQAIQHVTKFSHSTEIAAVQTVAFTCLLYGLLNILQPVCAVTCGTYGKVVWVVARGLVDVRIFVLAHDAMHGALSRHAEVNTWVGKVAGAVVFVPYDKWRWQHLHHHVVSGKIDITSIDHGDTTYWTKQQWDFFSPRRRFLLRLIRDPFVFFSIVPVAVFVLFFRVPRLRKSSKPDRVTGVAFTNWFKLTELCLGTWLLGWPWLWWSLTATAIAASLGFALFHLQHHVNHAYRKATVSHNRTDAALLGSTYLNVPACLKWATLGIEYHHIHHLSTRVPCYRLQECHESAPAGCWDDVTVVGPASAFRSMFNVMWNADTQLFEAFPEHEKLLLWLLPDTV